MAEWSSRLACVPATPVRIPAVYYYFVYFTFKGAHLVLSYTVTCYFIGELSAGESFCEMFLSTFPATRHLSLPPQPPAACGDESLHTRRGRSVLKHYMSVSRPI